PRTPVWDLAIGTTSSRTCAMPSSRSDGESSNLVICAYTCYLHCSAIVGVHLGMSHHVEPVRPRWRLAVKPSADKPLRSWLTSLEGACQRPKRVRPEDAVGCEPACALEARDRLRGRGTVLSVDRAGRIAELGECPLQQPYGGALIARLERSRRSGESRQRLRHRRRRGGRRSAHR